MKTKFKEFIIEAVNPKALGASGKVYLGKKYNTKPTAWRISDLDKTIKKNAPEGTGSVEFLGDTKKDLIVVNVTFKNHKAISHKEVRKIKL